MYIYIYIFFHEKTDPTTHVAAEDLCSAWALCHGKLIFVGSSLLLLAAAGEPTTFRGYW
jgi:hypothetical protein